MKKRTSLLLAISLAAAFALGGTGIYAAGEIARLNALDAETAYRFALNDAGVKSEEVIYLKSEQEIRAGQRIYDVDFAANGMEYEYKVNAADGSILEREMEPINKIGVKRKTQTVPSAGTAAATTPAPTTAAEAPAPTATAATPENGSGTAAPESKLTTYAALAIALERAGLTEAEVTVTELKLEWDDGREVYDVEFFLPGKTEYEFEIDAVTGEILEEKTETVKTAKTTAGQTAVSGSSEKPAPSKTTEAPSSTISVEDAKAIALKRAGKSADEVVFSKAKLERDDGIWVYEIEFHIVGVMEYEYEIDASTGAILEEDIEAWDD